MTAPGPEEPGQFAFADPKRVVGILKGGFFREVSFTAHDPPVPWLTSRS
jgi:hypothetical protein